MSFFFSCKTDSNLNSTYLSSNGSLQETLFLLSAHCHTTRRTHLPVATTVELSLNAMETFHGFLSSTLSLLGIKCALVP